jgi:[NiFe] hydrogenase diaphorase moiety small subunit
MKELIRFVIDGKECMASTGTYLVEAARQNNVYIPTLCNIPGIKPRGACRICTVRCNGMLATACTSTVAEGMTVENDSPELNDMRKAIVELLFAEGNHLCPSCEKSGECELQALAYRFRVMAPRFPFLFPVREVEASLPKLLKDHNRCILCKRCIRAIKTADGKSLFAFKRRGHQLVISIDTALAHEMSDELAQKAMDICPVGAIIRKERGFVVPIGKRTYDAAPIGSEVEAGGR